MNASLASLVGARCVGCRTRVGVACPQCLGDVGAAGMVRVADLDRVAAVWRHEGVARELVLGLKLRGLRMLARPLVDGLVELAMREGTVADVVTWPPCSRTDKRSRGFDHAELLARGVAARLGLPAEPLLKRVGRAEDQAGLSGDQRRRNLVDAFTARREVGLVLLVDDVVTTGATLQACATALRGAGATQIEGLTVCSAYS